MRDKPGPLKITNNIELCSIHIPKSAGTSFRNIMVDVYGKKNLIRLDVNIDDELKIDEQPYNKPSLPDNVKVIHGHYSIAQLKEQLEISEDVKIITWIRHPVERAISNYYYLVERLEARLIHTNNSRRTLSRLIKTLQDFCAFPRNRNRSKRFLRGVKLDELDFVGITEHFDEDIHDLAEIMGWPKVQSLAVNKTQKKESNIDPSLLKLIEEWNAEDMELYHRALELREERRKSLSRT